MPNHCFNKVTISVGDADGQNLKVLVDSLKSEENQTDFDFNAILPMPPELENVDWSEAEEMNDIIRARYKKEHGSDNWYDWRVNNWGTKWNSYDCFLEEEDDDYVVYTFNTAWGPPTGVIEALREQCPDFSISAFFDEPGMEQAGYY
tara:strand:+ start:4600 stop:5040 length:441 start_codon:yes stop_codon:yes gene_type:complete